MNSIIGWLRYQLINKPQRRKQRKAQRPEFPRMRLDEMMYMLNNHAWRDRYGRRV